MTSSSARRYTTRHVKLAVALYLQGFGCPAVSREIGTRLGAPAPSVKWVYRCVTGAGIARSKSRALEVRWIRESGRDYDELRERAVALAAEKNFSRQQVAEELGVSSSFAKRQQRAVLGELAREFEIAVEEEGMLRMRHLAAWRRYYLADTPDVSERRERSSRCAELYLDGLTYTEISKKLRIPRGSIVGLLRMAGISVNRNHPKQTKDIAA